MKKYYMISFLSMLLLASVSNFSYGQEPPYIAPISDQTAMVGELFTYDVNAINAVPAETYELTKALPGMSINPSTGLISWTPVNPSDGGQVTVRAFNSEGESVRSFFIYLSDEIECSTDLISYWKMDETSGDTLEDYTGGYTATALNPITPVAGQVGGAQLLEPAGMQDQYMYVSDEGQYDFDRSVSFSISTWFKWGGEHNSEPNNHVLVARGNPEGTNTCLLLFVDNTSDANNPKVNFTLRPASDEELKSVSPNITLQPNQWYHVVAIYNGSPNGQATDLEVYVNNVRNYYPHQFTDTDFVGYGLFDLNIGFWDAYESNRFPFNGTIDEVLFYRKALSSSEVSDIYNDGLANIPHCKPGNYYPLITSTPVEVAGEGDVYTYTLTANDLDGETLVKSADILPSWLDFNPTTGVLTGTPGNENIGDTIVKLSVADSEITVSQEYTLSVTNVNDAPEITSTPDVTQINQGETFSYTVVVTDNDPDDVVTLTAPGLPDWMTFTPATGVLEGTPTNDQVGFSADSTFDISIVATDLADATDTQDFTLTVININDAPEVVSQSTVTTDRNVDVDISIDDLTVNDPDHVFPTDHTFTILEGDDYSFSGNTVTPENNFYGELSVNTEISDGEDTTPYSFIITVNYVNIAPEFTSEPKTTGNEGSPYSYVIQVSDPDVDDPDINQELEITVITKPNWLTFDSETNILLGIPGRDDVGENLVSLKVSDGELEDEQEFTIVVISGNNAPVISTSPPLQVNNYSPYSYVISASDADPGDELAYSALLLPAWLSFDPLTQTLSGVPEKSDVGQHTVILNVTDGYDDVPQEFIITVLDVNTAPVVTSSEEDVTVEIDKLYTYLLEVVDYEGDALIITPISLPDWLSYDQGSKVLSGTPTSADIDVHDVIFSITDGAFTILFDIDITVVTEISVDLQDAIVSNVYPVPASEFVIFEIQNQKGYNLEISDITGKVVYSYEIDPNTDRHRVDLAGMDKGIYIYRIYNDDEQQSGRLIVK